MRWVGLVIVGMVGCANQATTAPESAPEAWSYDSVELPNDVPSDFRWSMCDLADGAVVVADVSTISQLTSGCASQEWGGRAHLSVGLDVRGTAAGEAPETIDAVFFPFQSISDVAVGTMVVGSLRRVDNGWVLFEALPITPGGTTSDPAASELPVTFAALQDQAQDVADRFEAVCGAARQSEQELSAALSQSIQSCD